MDVIDDLTQANFRQETVATIGAFDGLHRGHQMLIQEVVRRARAAERLAVLVTFHPHPAVVLRPDSAPRYLTTPGEKLALLAQLGLDLVVLLPFDRQMASTPAHVFLESLSRHLQVRELWVGAAFALGRNREGDVPHLRELGLELGYELYVTEPVTVEDQVVSSSRIRGLLREGRVGEASKLLGRYPSLSGRVVIGAQRGRLPGYPTANLEVRAERAVPADGVYAVFALLGAERFLGVANVGARPAFDNGQRTVETHLLDFRQDIDSFDLVIEFVERLRDEKQFDDSADLLAQIGEDSAAAREILVRAKDAPDAGWESSMAVRPSPRPYSYRYQEIEHTADRALRVWGKRVPDLFAGAARGMYGLMADVSGLAATSWREIEFDGRDRESLLVDWLNELLFLTESEGLLFVEYEFLSLTGTRLVARVGGTPGSVTRAGIKAATFHNLVLVEGDEGWSTVITFDV